jgi:hypothetical protein
MGEYSFEECFRIKGEIFQNLKGQSNIISKMLSKIGSYDLSEKTKHMIAYHVPIFEVQGNVIAYQDFFNKLEFENFDIYLKNLKDYFTHQTINYINYYKINVKYFQISNINVDKICNLNNLSSLNCLMIKSKEKTVYSTLDIYDENKKRINEFSYGVIWEGKEYKYAIENMGLLKYSRVPNCNIPSAIVLHQLSNGENMITLFTSC